MVSSEDDAEVRRVSVTNAGARVREIEITSYAELVLAPQAADVAHPAFSKLFVETEFLDEVGALVATRRRRDPAEPEIWVGQLAVVDGETVGKTEIETDRARFIGRGQSVRTPIAMIDGRKLSNTVGAVLDPIFALRRRVRIAPGAVARISFWTMAASTRETLLDIVDKHRDATAYSRATTLAWTQAQVQLHHLGVTTGEASLFQRLASHVIYANPTLRPPSGTILRGAGAQSGLWPLGVSGDLPIVLLRISDADDLDIARELLQAHEYWRMKQLAVDLVILNERQSSYVQDLQVALETLIRTRQMRPRLRGEDSAGGVFVLRGDLIPAETSALLASVARVVLVAQRGGLFAQIERIVETPTSTKPTASAPAKSADAPDPVARAGAGEKTGIFQRARRLRQGRPGICDDSWTGPGDAGPLDQCRRQREFRLPGGDRRQRLHLVGQQPREPAHALVERSRRRSPGRGLFSARRRCRRICGARPRCPSASRRRPISPATVAATAGSSMRATASNRISCNSCRSTRRSRYRG